MTYLLITLINCNAKLISLGIDMNAVGSGDLLENQLVSVIPSYQAWEYDFSQDQLKIWVLDGTEIPDLSIFGEVYSVDSFMG